jgi:hypothetical protein
MNNLRAIVSALRPSNWRLLLAIGGVLPAASAGGATPEAWAAHRQEVMAACASASTLRDPRSGGRIVQFDDRGK